MSTQLTVKLTGELPGVALGQICRKLRQDEMVGKLTVAAALIRAEREE
jgi:hypothetical protein